MYVVPESGIISASRDLSVLANKFHIRRNSNMQRELERRNRQHQRRFYSIEREVTY